MKGAAARPIRSDGDDDLAELAVLLQITVDFDHFIELHADRERAPDAR